MVKISSDREDQARPPEGEACTYDARGLAVLDRFRRIRERDASGDRREAGGAALFGLLTQEEHRAMIEPVRHGVELRDEVHATRPEPGALAVWWLGQSGFLIKSRSGTLVIDLYLSEHLTRKYAGTDK